MEARDQGRYAAGLTEMASGMLACSKGEWRRALRRLVAAERQLRETRSGVAWELDTARCFRVLALLQLGRLRELFAELPSLLEPAGEQQDLYLEIHLRHWVESLRHLAADEPAAARQTAAATIERWSHQGFHYQHFGHLFADVQVALYEGRGRAAWQRVEERWGELAQSRIQRIEMVLVQSHDLRGRAALAAACETEDRRLRRRRLATATAAARRLERAGSSWALGLASLLRAGAATLAGERGAVVARLELAETAFAGSDMALYAAVARRRRAQISRTDTVPLVALADQTLVNLGVRRPERWSAMLAPGRWMRGSSTSGVDSEG